MRSLMQTLKIEEDKLDLEQENIHGVYKEMKAVLEKKVQLYRRFQKEEGFAELDRIVLENKENWQLTHLIGLIKHEESIVRLNDLTKRIDKLEKKAGLS